MGFKGVHIAWTCFPDDKIGKNNEICCENYDVDDDGGDGGRIVIYIALVTPIFFCIKVGYKKVFITRTCF